MPQQQHIHCTVNTCHYWASGNKCDASEIVVVSDAFAAATPDRVDATQAVNLDQTPTGNCMETCCKTFVRKGSGDERLDGIYKQS
ncbi:hypothetical protein Tfer_1094 [Thermincola ferriacetica]|uniref:DUF1540 domain-containing protein n=2 Tax=Thermincola TaxID=278993 RepID=D5X844_THEPJ|nr:MULTISPECIES: DUF1540 domain-containing protein [Thermincola]ADG82764.1 protein of unknown function DUF1540 [Thermincola potens JR]KNZ70218.1 hypothetical protein Tfer_1094 [Thermincola ferriacetica]